MTQAARDALRRLEGVLAENSEPLRSTIANFNTFSAALARNSDRLDGIITGVERLTGAGPTAAPPIIYDLTAPRVFPPLKTPAGQLSVPEPTGVLMFDTQKILVRPGGAEGPTFANARWSDTIPKLLQARIIQSFENANLLGAIARPMESLTASHQLLIDIRSFQLSLSAAPMAEVEFAAKIVGDGGRIVGAKIFRAIVPAPAADARTASAALDEAFGSVATDLVVWAVGVI